MEPVKNIDLSDLKPLPDELQNLTREDSECKYCGIPYLILHEVKELQKKCTELEAQLGKYHAAVSVRAQLEEALKVAEQELKRLEELPALKSEFGRLHELVASLEDECATMEKERDQLDMQLQEEKSATALLKLNHSQLESDHKSLETQHASLQSQSRDLRQGLDLKLEENQNLYAQLENLQKIQKDTSVKIAQTTAHHKELTQQNAALEGKCENLEATIGRLKSDNQTQASGLTSARSELEAFRDARGELEQRMVKIKQESVQVESMNAHLETQLEISKKTAALKGEHADAKIAKLTEENVQLKSGFHGQSKSLEIFRSNEELLKKKLTESQTTAHEAEKKSGELSSKVTTLEQELKTTISSHQARLEELTEFYRVEISKFKETQKAEIELDKIKAQYAVEIVQREQALKEYFQVELEIEVEKRVESIKLQCQHTLLGTEDDLNQAREEKRTLEAHCEDLQRQLKGNRTRAMAVENELNTQIGKLKSTVDRLRTDMNVLLQKQMLHDKQQKQATPPPQIISSEIDQKIKGYETKIAELERTVQRECEERMALLADRDSDVSSRHFSSSTLKLLNLTPAGKYGGGGEGSISESRSQPIVYIPQNLADLTKSQRVSPSKAPLPGLGSGVGSGIRPGGIGGIMQHEKSMVSGSSRNTNTQRAPLDTGSIKSNHSSTRRKANGEASDMDALRRKIRLAINQRQRQKSSGT